MPVVPVRAAFVTLVTTDDYCPGAQVLAYSLRHHKTRHSLVCLVTPNLSPGATAALKAAFDEVVEVPCTDSGDVAGLQVLGRPELGVTFTKVEAWTLTKYTVACFLDADTMALRNVDDLLDETTYRPFAAAPDSGWPDCFNSGVFIFRPSREDYDQLKILAKEGGSFDGADQGLLNTYFNSWSRSGVEHRLPFTYNVTPSAVYSYAPAFRAFHEDIAIFHFIGVKKPWHWLRLQDGGIISNGDEVVTDIVRRWWAIHDIYVSKWNGQGLYSQETALSFSCFQHAESTSGAGALHPSTIHVVPSNDLGEYRVNWDADEEQIEPIGAQPASTSSSSSSLKKASSAKPTEVVLPTSLPYRQSMGSPKLVRLTSNPGRAPFSRRKDGQS